MSYLDENEEINPVPTPGPASEENTPEETPELAEKPALTLDELGDDATMDELMAAYEDTLADLTEGKIVSGVIVAVSDDEVLIDVGYKSEGPVDRKEFGGVEMSVGDEVEVFLEKKEDQDGIIVLSKEKADFARTWENIKQAFEDGTTIEGRVITRIKGGLEVDVGARGFLPASQVALRPVRDLDTCVGQTYEMRVIKINRRRRNIVLSRKVLLQEKRETLKTDLVAELEEGQIREGEVKNITDFGAFIDLGGLDGLLHITDMSWGRISHPSEVVDIGSKIKVLVLSYDQERERVSLGLKQLTPHPWKDAAVKYSEGAMIRGKVVNMTDYGAFVEIEDGIEGLVHISEMSWTQRIRHPSQLLSIGELVNVKVLSLDAEKHRISLGLKQTENDPWETIAERFPRGTRLMGRVRNITDFGAFIEVEEGIDGLVHISDMSWLKRVRHPSEVLNKGDELEVVILNVDIDNRRISLGMKQLEEDPWDRIEDFVWDGAYVEGTVVRMARFGAIIELTSGIEALLHISEIVDAHVPNIDDLLLIDEQLTCKVINVDRAERKVNLSLKAYNTDMNIAPEDDPIMKRLIERQEAGEISLEAPEEGEAEAVVTEDEEGFEAMPAPEVEESAEEVVEEPAAEAEVADTEEVAETAEEVEETDASEVEETPETEEVTEAEEKPEEVPEAEEAEETQEEAPAEADENKKDNEDSEEATE